MGDYPGEEQRILAKLNANALTVRKKVLLLNSPPYKPLAALRYKHAVVIVHAQNRIYIDGIECRMKRLQVHVAGTE